MEIITSKSNSKVKLAASLNEKKYRLENGMFLIEGRKILDMGLEAKLVDTIFTTKELKNIDSAVKIYKVTDEIIEKISNEKNPEGIVAICKFRNWEKDYSKYKKIVYLDDVSDPGNMGTIIRTALAFNYDAVVLSKNCVDIYNPKVITAARGAIFLLPIFNDDLGRFSNKEIIVSALSDKAVSLEKVNKKDDFVLVLGNEAHGVSENSLRMANQVVKIDISDSIDSLNVAIAGGILMHELKNK
ncbi:MAG: RNA methyltransferase [Bacilli bacterium]|nr:RNA methyltransferase [Bacilli bacterium]